MNLKKRIILVMVTLFTITIYAQSYQVTGKVTDADNQPLPGVSITIEGTSRGTSTDFNGTYTIMVQSSENLIFSYVGYNEKKLQMDGTKTFNVVLSAGVELKEILEAKLADSNAKFPKIKPFNIKEIGHPVLTELGKKLAGF